MGDTHAIRVELPHHLRTLARLDGDLTIEVAAPVTLSSLLDAIEARYPMLRGTMRDQVSGRRRAYVRFFACEQDLSHTSVDDRLPDAVTTGREPFLVVGAMSGGSDDGIMRG